MRKVIQQIACGRRSETVVSPSAPQAYRDAQTHLNQSHDAQCPVTRSKHNAAAMQLFEQACQLDPQHLPAQAGVLQALRESRYQYFGLRNSSRQAARQAQALVRLGDMLARDDGAEARLVLQNCADLFSGCLLPAVARALSERFIPHLGARISTEGPGLPIVDGLRGFLRLTQLQPWTCTCVLPWLHAWSRLERLHPPELEVVARLLEQLLAVNEGLAQDVLRIVRQVWPRLQADPASAALCVNIVGTLCRLTNQNAALLRENVALLAEMGRQFPFEQCGYEAVRNLLDVALGLVETHTPDAPAPQGLQEIAETALTATVGIVLLAEAETGFQHVAQTLRGMVQRRLESLERQPAASLEPQTTMPIAFAASQALTRLTEQDAG